MTTHNHSHSHQLPAHLSHKLYTFWVREAGIQITVRADTKGHAIADIAHQMGLPVTGDDRRTEQLICINVRGVD